MSRKSIVLLILLENRGKCYRCETDVRRQPTGLPQGLAISMPKVLDECLKTNYL